MCFKAITHKFWNFVVVPNIFQFSLWFLLWPKDSWEVCSLFFKYLRNFQIHSLIFLLTSIIIIEYILYDFNSIKFIINLLVLWPCVVERKWSPPARCTNHHLQNMWLPRTSHDKMDLQRWVRVLRLEDLGLSVWS